MLVSVVLTVVIAEIVSCRATAFVTVGGVAAVNVIVSSSCKIRVPGEDDILEEKLLSSLNCVKLSEGGNQFLESRLRLLAGWLSLDFGFAPATTVFLTFKLLEAGLQFAQFLADLKT